MLLLVHVVPLLICVVVFALGCTGLASTMVGNRCISLMGQIRGVTWLKDLAAKKLAANERKDFSWVGQFPAWMKGSRFAEKPIFRLQNKSGLFGEGVAPELDKEKFSVYFFLGKVKQSDKRGPLCDILFFARDHLFTGTGGTGVQKTPIMCAAGAWSHPMKRPGRRRC